MKNKLFKQGLAVLILILFYSIGAMASKPDSIETRVVDGKKYIIHRIEPGEGWYSIARRYNISYAELRMANKELTDKLVIGKTLRVPVAVRKPNDPSFEKNYTQEHRVARQAIYTVKEGDTYFSIAKQCQVPVDSLITWNSKAGATSPLKPNQQIFLERQNRSAKQDPTKVVETAIKPEKKDSTVMIKTAAQDRQPDAKKNSPAAKRTGKETSESGIAAWVLDEDINPNKYFALHRNAPVGTIIKVTNKMNSRYVFVRVVGQLPESGDNKDLVIKISKASAEKLGVRDARFQCELNYFMGDAN